MAAPARADGPEPHGPERRPDPRASGWGDVREGLIVGSAALVLSVSELAARPDDDAALQMSRLCLSAMEYWVEIGRRWVLDEAVLAEERQRGYDEGYAACQAARCRLEVIHGGQA